MVWSSPDGELWSLRLMEAGNLGSRGPRDMRMSVWACAPLNGGPARPPLGGFFDALCLRAAPWGALRAERELVWAAGSAARRQRDAEVGVDERGEVVGDGDAALARRRRRRGLRCRWPAGWPPAAVRPCSPAAVVMPALSCHADDPCACCNSYRGCGAIAGVSCRPVTASFGENLVACRLYPGHGWSTSSGGWSSRRTGRCHRCPLTPGPVHVQPHVHDAWRRGLAHRSCLIFRGLRRSAGRGCCASEGGRACRSP